MCSQFPYGSPMGFGATPQGYPPGFGPQPPVWPGSQMPWAAGALGFSQFGQSPVGVVPSGQAQVLAGAVAKAVTSVATHPTYTTTVSSTTTCTVTSATASRASVSRPSSSLVSASAPKRARRDPSPSVPDYEDISGDESQAGEADNPEEDDEEDEDLEVHGEADSLAEAEADESLSFAAKILIIRNQMSDFIPESIPRSRPPQKVGLLSSLRKAQGSTEDQPMLPLAPEIRFSLESPREELRKTSEAKSGKASSTPRFPKKPKPLPRWYSAYSPDFPLDPPKPSDGLLKQSKSSKLPSSVNMTMEQARSLESTARSSIFASSFAHWFVAMVWKRTEHEKSLALSSAWPSLG